MWKEPKSDHAAAAASCDQTGVGGGKGEIIKYHFDHREVESRGALERA